MFREFNIHEGKINPFKMIGRQWMLICAGDKNSYNMMTASWGGFGVLWNRDICIAFVRPERYTYKFMERNDYFTLSFLGDEKRDLLSLCGTKSGRDIDKMNIPGLTPAFKEPGFIYFLEAEAVILAKKIYWQDIEPGNFLDGSIMDNYPGCDYHRLYIGEIEKALIRP